MRMGEQNGEIPMWNRLVIYLIAILLVLSLASCGGEDETTVADHSSGENDSTVADEEDPDLYTDEKGDPWSPWV